jgi:hypothetical protein
MLTGMRWLILLTLCESVFARMMCYDIPSPRQPNVVELVDCWADTILPIREKMHYNVGAMKDFLIPAVFGTFASPITSILNMPALPAPDGNASMAFQFNIACDDAVADNCALISKTLMMAGWLLSQVIYDIKRI